MDRSAARHHASEAARWLFDAGRARCLDVYRTGATFELQTRDRWSTFVLERRTGNPERF